MERDTWTIGELADECGLTVRALRHFEDKGLLAPARRTTGGHRTYDRADVERAYRVVALRGLGLSLARIAAALASPLTLGQALAEHLAQVERQIGELEGLREQLRRLVGAGRPASMEELIRVIHQTPVSQEILEEYLDQAQRSELAARAAELGDEATQMVEVDYPKLYQAADKQFRAGRSPADPAVQEIAGQLESLAARWSDQPTDTVQQMWIERSEDITGHDFADLGEYVMAARALWRAQH